MQRPSNPSTDGASDTRNCEGHIQHVHAIGPTPFFRRDGLKSCEFFSPGNFAPWFRVSHRALLAAKQSIMKHTLHNILGVAALLATTIFPPAPAHAQQASLTLDNGDLALCYGNITSWSLTKTVDGVTGPKGDNTVTWTVTGTKGQTSGNQLLVSGYMTVKNTGSAGATIGNIVVNLQKMKNVATTTKPNWVWASISASVANAAQGSAATKANIAAKASQEIPSYSQGAYTVSGARGTFTENALAGPLQLVDLDSNDVWAISPKKTIAPGQSVRLVFKAKFDASVMGIAQGTLLRAEVIISFGNAGMRGGSGSSATNIDISGNGSVDADETNVRSVPTRVTENVPELEQCHRRVTLGDAGIATTGTVSYANVEVSGMPTEPVSGTTNFSVAATGVDGGAGGGTISNTATLKAEGSDVSLLIGYQTVTDPITGLPAQKPVYYTFACCEPLSLSVAATAEIEHPVGLAPGDYCSFSQGGFGGRGTPYLLLASYFPTLFPSGLEVGIPGNGGNSVKFTSSIAVQNYLPAGGTPNKLTLNLADPTSSSSGVFGGQVLALKLNIALSDCGATPAGLGELYYLNPGDSLNGFTVRKILAAAETALGGGALPAGYTYASLSTLCDNLNLSWDTVTDDGCIASGWAMLYLSKTP